MRDKMDKTKDNCATTASRWQAIRADHVTRKRIEDFFAWDGRPNLEKVGYRSSSELSLKTSTTEPLKSSASASLLQRRARVAKTRLGRGCATTDEADELWSLQLAIEQRIMADFPRLYLEQLAAWIEEELGYPEG